MPWHSRGWFAHVMVMIGVLCLAVGCSSKPKPTADAKSVSGTDEQIFLGDTIEKNYDPNVIMKRGEAFFDKEEFAEAIVEYQHFLNSIAPTHSPPSMRSTVWRRAISGWANRSTGTRIPYRKRLPPSKSCGRISPAVSMKPRPSSA